MYNAVSDLLHFHNVGDVPSSLRNAIEILGRKNVRVIAVEILSWLKRQHRFGQETPLVLKDQYTWCQDIPHFFELVPPLHQIFIIRDNNVTFRDNVTMTSRNDIRKLVADEYRPTLRT